MYKDWPQTATDLTTAVREVRKGIPETMKAFSSLARAALEAKALDTKTKELIAILQIHCWLRSCDQAILICRSLKFCRFQSLQE